MTYFYYDSFFLYWMSVTFYNPFGNGIKHFLMKKWDIFLYDNSEMAERQRMVQK